MMSITTTTPGSVGAVIIRNYQGESDIRKATARISKAKTLDGGVVVIHSGFADGDRALIVNALLSEVLSDDLWTIFTSETFVNVAIPEGVFSAVIKTLRVDRGETRMTIELESKLSA